MEWKARQNGADSILFTWEKVPGANRYFVFKVTPAGLELLHHTDQTSFVMRDNLMPGSPIKVQIIASGPLGKEQEVKTGRVGAVPERQGALQTPMLAAAGAGPIQVTLTFTWEGAVNATGYRIEHQKTQAVDFGPNDRIETEEVRDNRRSFTMEHADRLQKYRFRVVAKNRLGESRATEWRNWP